MTALHDCSADDRLHALECAARVLVTTWPKLQHSATVQLGGRPVQVIFARMPSGAVTVARRDTGTIVAQSAPAQLSVLDPELFPVDPEQGDDEAFSLVADEFGRSELLLAVATVIERPSFRALSVSEMAYVLRTWADRLNDR